MWLLTFLACGQTISASEAVSGGADVIVFNHHESSYEGAESYEITVKPSGATKVVMVQGKVVRTESKPLDAAAFGKVMAEVGAGFSKKVGAKQPGCSGSSFSYLEMRKGAQVLFEAGAEHCGGGVDGELRGDIDSLEDRLDGLVR